MREAIEDASVTASSGDVPVSALVLDGSIDPERMTCEDAPKSVGSSAMTAHVRIIAR